MYCPFTFQCPVQVQRFFSLWLWGGKKFIIFESGIAMLECNRQSPFCGRGRTQKSPCLIPRPFSAKGQMGNFHTKSVHEPVRIKKRSLPRLRRGRDPCFTCFIEDLYHIKGANRFRTLLSARTYHLLLRHSACTTCLHCKRDIRYSSRMLPMAGHRNSQAPHSKCM